MKDSPFIPKLIETAGSKEGLAQAQVEAEKALIEIAGMSKADAHKLHNGCAAVLSALLRDSGIDVSKTTGAGHLADKLRDRGWQKVTAGHQQAGDVGVCWDYTAPSGADHVYLVVKRVDDDEMVIADNQAKTTHQRFATGKGKTPTEYFLRASDAGTVPLSTKHAIAAFASNAAPAPASCSVGWYVTGYFTPVESDFTDSPVSIEVKGVGTFGFPASFLSKTKVEGWGRTRFGWCVGWYGGSWHKADHPEDAKGHALDTVAVAVDPKLIPTGSKLTIPSLPSPMNHKQFVARDVGEAIIGKHIDVYCGEGQGAELITFKITGHGQTVCL